MFTLVRVLWSRFIKSPLLGSQTNGKALLEDNIYTELLLFFVKSNEKLGFFKIYNSPSIKHLALLLTKGRKKFYHWNWSSENPLQIVWVDNFEISKGKNFTYWSIVDFSRKKKLFLWTHFHLLKVLASCRIANGFSKYYCYSLTN